MAISIKAKIPYAEAIKRAEVWKDTLLCLCEKVALAGSLRRKKATVGDIEMVFVPKRMPKAADLFDAVFGNSKPPVLVDVTDSFFETALKDGMLSKRIGQAGHTAWGPSNKLAIDVASGIPIDFFSTTLECFPMLLVIRTGGKQTNINLANAAARRGWKLKPYHGGYQNRRTGEMHICKTEEECFTFVGLQCPPPTHRP